MLDYRRVNICWRPSPNMCRLIQKQGTFMVSSPEQTAKNVPDTEFLPPKGSFSLSHVLLRNQLAVCCRERMSISSIKCWWLVLVMLLPPSLHPRSLTYPSKVTFPRGKDRLPIIFQVTILNLTAVFKNISAQVNLRILFQLTGVNFIGKKDQCNHPLQGGPRQQL